MPFDTQFEDRAHYAEAQWEEMTDIPGERFEGDIHCACGKPKRSGDFACEACMGVDMSRIPCPGCHHVACQCASPDAAFILIEELGVFVLPESSWPTWVHRLTQHGLGGKLPYVAD